MCRTLRNFIKALPVLALPLAAGAQSNTVLGPPDHRIRVAMYVVYDSPLVMVADNPEAYKNPDGRPESPLDFLAGGVRYRAEILQDGKDRGHLAASTAQPGQNSRIKLALAGGGGALVVLTPLAGAQAHRTAP